MWADTKFSSTSDHIEILYSRRPIETSPTESVEQISNERGEHSSGGEWPFVVVGHPRYVTRRTHSVLHSLPAWLRVDFYKICIFVTEEKWWLPKFVLLLGVGHFKLWIQNFGKYWTVCCFHLGPKFRGRVALLELHQSLWLINGRSNIWIIVMHANYKLSKERTLYIFTANCANHEVHPPFLRGDHQKKSESVCRG